MKKIKPVVFIFCLIALLTGCRGNDKETRIKGIVNYNGTGLSEATIEIYLKRGKDKSIPPFMTGETTEDGNFIISLPPGRYFVIGKKRFMEGGITKMLMGEYPKNPVIVKSGDTVTISPFSLFNMGEDKRLDIEGSGITGNVTHEGVAPEGAFLYVYPESNPNMIGPSYVVSTEIEGDGKFKVNLLPGSYYVAIRKRSSMTKLGYLDIGDLSADYKGNPITVKEDEYLDLGEFKLHEVDSERLKKIKADEAKLVFSVKITGSVTDEEGEPVSGIYVYAYKDPKMVGKPEALSKETDETGDYTLYLTTIGNDSKEHKYYIGARTNFGGPLEPGEYVGTYNENPEHVLTITGGEDNIEDIDITVKEVW
jgi:hypothetical protein